MREQIILAEDGKFADEKRDIEIVKAIKELKECKSFALVYTSNKGGGGAKSAVDNQDIECLAYHCHKMGDQLVKADKLAVEQINKMNKEKSMDSESKMTDEQKKMVDDLEVLLLELSKEEIVRFALVSVNPERLAKLMDREQIKKNPKLIEAVTKFIMVKMMLN